MREEEKKGQEQRTKPYSIGVLLKNYKSTNNSRYRKSCRGINRASSMLMSLIGITCMITKGKVDTDEHAGYVN